MGEINKMNSYKMNLNRRKFLTNTTAAVGGIGMAFASVPFIGSWLPSAKAKALRDPNSNESLQPEYARNDVRSIKDNILVLLGLCTHLGCVPLYKPKLGELDSSWKGGFFCPCHGSKFDLSGRVFKGVPAPTNLSIPPHKYVGANRLVIGE